MTINLCRQNAKLNAKFDYKTTNLFTGDLNDDDFDGSNSISNNARAIDTSDSNSAFHEVIVGDEILKVLDNIISLVEHRMDISINDGASNITSNNNSQSLAILNIEENCVENASVLDDAVSSSTTTKN
jgi:hypothetical protein